MIAIVLIVISKVEQTFNLTEKQFANFGMTLAVFVCNMGLKDAVMYAYCRNRNEEKHTLAATVRKYMRWLRLIKFMESVRALEE